VIVEDEYEYYEALAGFDGDQVAPPEGAGWELMETFDTKRGTGRPTMAHRWRRRRRSSVHSESALMCPYCGYPKNGDDCQRLHP